MGTTCPLTLAPRQGHIQPNPGGDGCSTGHHVPSNPMHDLIAPCAKGKTHGGSAPLVMGPQAGPYSIHSRGGRGAVRAPMSSPTPCMTPLHHVPRGRSTVGARPLLLADEWGHIQSIPGGKRCSTGPHVPSNSMRDPIAPRAKEKTHSGSAPHFIGQQVGPFSIHSRGEGGAIRAPMCPLTPRMIPMTHVPRGRCTVGARPLSLAHEWGHIQSITGGGGAVPAPLCPLTPCMTPLHHVPRTRRTKGARPLASHDLTQTAFSG